VNGLSCDFKSARMEYKKLVAITGLSGLYEMISSKSDGGLVRSLADKSTKFASNRLHNFSHLESIEVYTTADNVNLTDVFMAMQTSSEALPDAGNAAAVKAYFGKVYPTMDFERVYASDMKKMVKWFEQLRSNNIEIKLSDETDEAIPEQAEKKSAPKPVEQKAATVKNAPAKKVNAPRKMV
jgi:hypothetical protein